MKIARLFLAFLVLAALGAGGGCKTTKEKEEEIAKPVGRLPDQSGDTSFQAFLATLRKAAAKRDARMLADLMTPDFGYSWEPGGQGIGVFDYWNHHHLWGELNAVLNQKFVPMGNYMVAPPQFAHMPDYRGYRAGLRLEGGAWRFAYFVPPEP